MIKLRCSHCGSDIELDDSRPGQSVRCARCGHVMSTSPDQSKTELGAPSPFIVDVLDDGDFVEPGTADHDDDEETLSPKPSAKVEAFPFLSPPRESDEIGWLGHYKVIRLLGQGGMGIVFEAIDTHLQRPVALKVMKPEIAQDESARQRFLREARAMASIRSDHVVTVHQVGQKHNVPFAAMEFLQGEPLDRWLERYGRPSLDDLLRIGIELSRGLAAAHVRGLIHRDIKPGNIFLEQAEGAPATEDRHRRSERPPFRVKILDFGLARVTRDRAQLTQRGLVIGTPAYMAPEQIEGKEVDARCDLFSVGCVLYLLATGQAPFSGPNSMAILLAVANKHPKPPRELNPSLPAPLAKLILKLLAKNPKQRPSSALDVVHSLESIAAELGFSPWTPATGIAHGRDSADSWFGALRNRRIAWSAAIVAALLLAGFLGWWAANYFQDDSPDARADGVVQGVSDTEILLGMTGPFSGPARELGRDMEIGIDTYFEQVNERGGIHGRRLRLVSLDDGFDPDRALANVRSLHDERKVFAIVGNVGTPTAEKSLHYALDKNLLFFGAYSGGRILRKDPPDRHVFNYRASVEEEIAAIVHHLINVKRISPEAIALFAQNDAVGDDALDGLAKHLKRERGHILRVGHDRNSADVAEAVSTITKRSDIEAVVLAATYRPASLFIKRVKDAKPDMTFASVSFVGSNALADALTERGAKYADGMIVTQVVPPIDSGGTLVRKYREHLKKHHPQERPSFTSLEGYLVAVLFAEGLERAGKKLDTEALADTFESIRDLDLGTGTLISFGPSEHQASHRVWGTMLDKEGRYRVIEGFR